MGLFPTDPRERKMMLLGLQIAGDFGISIAIPVVFFSWTGQWFDEKYHSYPRYLIIGFVLAAGLSARIIYKKAKLYSHTYQSLTEKRTNGSTDSDVKEPE